MSVSIRYLVCRTEIKGLWKKCLFKSIIKSLSELFCSPKLTICSPDKQRMDLLLWKRLNQLKKKNGKPTFCCVSHTCRVNSWRLLCPSFDLLILVLHPAVPPAVPPAEISAVPHLYCFLHQQRSIQSSIWFGNSMTHGVWGRFDHVDFQQLPVPSKHTDTLNTPLTNYYKMVDFQLGSWCDTTRLCGTNFEASPGTELLQNPDNQMTPECIWRIRTKSSTNISQ